MLIEGLSFGSYEVQRRAAIGGLGEVYLCQHRDLNRIDALKVLRPHLAHDPRFRRRFLREGLSAARIRHPHVLTVYTADETDGLLYLAMEYVEGDDLATLLARQGRLAVPRAVALLRVAADALDAAHRSRLVHRDVKPGNLLVTGVGQPLESLMLVGFGVSRLFDEERETPGENLEMVAYAAPEQLARHLVTGACDQYSLACVAFECLTGSIPFPGSTQVEVVTAHLQTPPPQASAVAGGLPSTVDAVFARALAKDPAERFTSCGAFIESLGQALGLESAMTTLIPAFPTGERLALPAVPTSTSTSTSGELPMLASPMIEPTALLVPVRADRTAILPRIPDEPMPGSAGGAPPAGGAARAGATVAGGALPATPAAGSPLVGPLPPSLPVLDLPDPVALFAAVESSLDLTTGDAGLAVRLGLADPPAVGSAVLRLAAGPIALRAEPASGAGPLRWLLAQVAATHSAGQLCLAVALAPVEDETWLWVNWLGVARPSTPPLTGSHVATTPAAARDLVARLRALVAARQAGSGPDSDWEPRVLALLDTRLHDRPVLSAAEWDAAASVGVHIVYLCGPGEPPPVTTTVDLDAGRFTVAAQGLRIEGEADGVDGAYVRRLAEILPER